MCQQWCTPPQAEPGEMQIWSTTKLVVRKSSVVGGRDRVLERANLGPRTREPVVLKREDCKLGFNGREKEIKDG